MLAKLLPLLLLVSCATSSTRRELPDGLDPNHAWLQQLVGTWHAVAPDASDGGAEIDIEKTVRRIGYYWIVLDCTVPFHMGAVTSQQTLGYVTKSNEFVGTWVDSSADYLWHYRGRLDSERRLLTSHATGPGFDGSSTAEYRDEIELVGPDEHITRNFIRADDGSWSPLGEVTFRRR